METTMKMTLYPTNLAEYQKRVAALEIAIESLKLGSCWCEQEGIDNPVTNGEHTAACLAIQALMAVTSPHRG